MATISEKALYSYRQTCYQHPEYHPENVTLITNARQTRNVGSGTVTTTRNSNPNWKQQIAQRVNAATPYYRDGYDFTVPSGQAISSFKSGATKITGVLQLESLGNGIPVFGSVSDAVLADQAVGKLKRKLATSIGDKQLMAPIAELGELRGLIRDSLHSGITLIQSLIDIKRTKGKSAFKYASDKWLSWGFGIAPTLSDIKESIAAVNKYYNRYDRNERHTATSKKDWVTGSVETNTLGAGINFRHHTTIHHSLSYKYTAGFELNLKSATDYGLADVFHLELGALVPTFWELVPYSWAVDYASTVGAYLEDTFTSDPTRCLYVVENVRYTATCQVNLTFSPIAGGFLSSNDPGFGVVKYWQFRRNLLTSLPNRLLRIKTVDEVGKHWANKLTNLAAVLLQHKL